MTGIGSDAGHRQGRVLMVIEGSRSCEPAVEVLVEGLPDRCRELMVAVVLERQHWLAPWGPLAGGELPGPLKQRSIDEASKAASRAAQVVSETASGPVRHQVLGRWRDVARTADDYDIVVLNEMPMSWRDRLVIRQTIDRDPSHWLCGSRVAGVGT